MGYLEEKEERQRRLAKEQQERQDRRQGLGSHWVKPPTVTTSEKWNGWEKSGGNLMDDNLSHSSSDSYLSDLGMDLKDLNLDNLEPVEPDCCPEIDMLEKHGEVWRPAASAVNEISIETGPVRIVEGGATGGKSPPTTAEKSKQPKC